MNKKIQTNKFRIIQFNTGLKFILKPELIKRVSQVKDSVDSISLSLPFISLNIKPKNKEREAAKEIVIRLSDKRVLNSFECCDDCIEKSLASLQEIRNLLVDKQVKLSGYSDSGLYLLIEMVLESIRQFFTYIEKEGVESKFYSSHYDKSMYLGTLELLRSHIYKCLVQIAKIANINIPRISQGMKYTDKWDTKYYNLKQD